MQSLDRTTYSDLPQYTPKILQFGGGNFLRAFTNWMIEVLNQETSFNSSVVLVKPTERGDYVSLRKQDGLFHVYLEGVKKGEHIRDNRLIKCISEIIHPYNEYQDFLNSSTYPEMRFIISNTTEAGIKFTEEPFSLEKPAKEFPGKLTAWLYHRFQHMKGDPNKGCILLPLELIERNGQKLKECIQQYIKHWDLGEDFLTWINEHNTFCDTLVDRIVSGYPTEKAASICQELGFKDDLLVAGEYYHSWVIQGPESVKKELPFEKTNLNVQFVEDLNPYREIKVRILNGAHTSMVPVGYLMGIRTVYEAMQNEHLYSFISDLLTEEVVPTLDFPQKASLDFRDDVLDRFRNPSIQHQLISISLNSISKFKTRLLPSLLEYVSRKGKLPARIVLALAALIRFYKGEYDQKEIRLNDNPAYLTFFKKAWKKSSQEGGSLIELVKEVLSQEDFWGIDLNQIDGLASQLAENLDQIEKGKIL